MNKLLMLFISLALWSCNDEPIRTTNSVDLSSCFSPEFGITEDEQFFYDVEFGELQVESDGNITSANKGYLIQEGSKIIFVYRHFLENNFDIIDDEVEIRILFQIDENLDSFSINSAEEFEKSNCIYAECGIALQSISGSINGNKTSDGNWSIDAKLEIDRFSKLKEVEINEVFIL